jgi:hypothetical protein
MLKFILLAITLSFSVSAQSATKAKELAELCANLHPITGEIVADAPDKFLSGLCVGYISGYRDSAGIIKYHTGKHYSCGGESASTGQLARIFLNYLAKHPEQLDKSAMAVLNIADMTAFPCKK